MKIIFLTLLTSILSFNGFAQDINLKVVVKGIEESKGTIYLSFHNTEKSFPSGNEEAIKTGQISKFTSVAEFTFKDLEEGEYAVSVFQDLNGNAELDTNFLGIPKEPVGVSKTTSFGRPKFSKSKFTLTKDSTITIQYMN